MEFVIIIYVSDGGYSLSVKKMDGIPFLGSFQHSGE
jgi:hypothetical protein